jgi:hypothetical protein
MRIDNRYVVSTFSDKRIGFCIVFSSSCTIFSLIQNLNWSRVNPDKTISVSLIYKQLSRLAGVPCPPRWWTIERFLRNGNYSDGEEKIQKFSSGQFSKYQNAEFLGRIVGRKLFEMKNSWHKSSYFTSQNSDFILLWLDLNLSGIYNNTKVKVLCKSILLS